MKDIKVLDFSIVLVGQIPVTLFTPNWLEKNGLIDEKRASKAEIKIIDPRLCVYDIPEWGSVEINANKLLIRTQSDSYHHVLRDTITSFLRVLNGNEITNIGINHIYHVVIDSDTYENIGKVFAPFSNWENILDDPKMLNLEMIQESREDGNDGRIRIKINPNDKFDGLAFSFNINEHFNRTGNAKNSAEEFTQLLGDVFDSVTENAPRYLEQFWQNLDKGLSNVD